MGNKPLKKWKGGKKNLRHTKWRKQGRACIYCRREIPYAHATLDHVFPRSQSEHENPDRDENLVVACWFCNQKRGDTPFTELLKLIDQLKKEGKLGSTRALNKTRLRKQMGLVRRLANIRYRPWH